jgi:hypothetical protein
MKISSIILAALAGSVAGTNNVCTSEQLSSLGMAMVQAAGSVNPNDYANAQLYLDAFMAAVSTALGGVNVASTYPCYSCLQTYIGNIYQCGPGCSDNQIAAYSEQMSQCATGQNTRSAFCPSTAAVATLAVASTFARF